MYLNINLYFKHIKEIEWFFNNGHLIYANYFSIYIKEKILTPFMIKPTI